MQGRRLRAALLFVLAFAITAPRASSPIPDPDYASALWVAESHGLLKVATADGQSLFEIPDADKTQAVALDESGGVVWTYGEDRLRAYDFGGQHLSETVIKAGGNDAYLSVDPVGGTVWLAAHKSLVHVDATGRILGEQSLAAPVLGLAFDGERRRVWVGESHRVRAFTADGELVAEILLPKKETLRALDVDSAHQALWLAHAHRIVRVDATGAETLSLPLQGVELLATDPEGGLWAATKKRLYRIDGDGRIEGESEPFDHQRTIVALAAGMSPVTAWAASQKEIANLGARAELLKRWQLERRDRIRAFAPYSDRLPPELAVTAPASGDYANTPLPEFHFSYFDIGRGVDAGTLKAEAGDYSLDLDCEVDESEATCRPVTAMADGRYTLKFTIADFAGNVSEPALLDLTIDTVPPGISVLSPVDGAWVNTPEITVAAQLDEPAEVMLNGQTLPLDIHHAFSRNVPLSEGANTFAIHATDRAGNAAAAQVTVNLDTVPPAVPLVGHIFLGDVVDGQVTVTGDPGSVEAGARVLVTNTRTGQTVEAIATADGRFTLVIAAEPGHEFSIQVLDAAGNRSEPGAVALAVANPTPGAGYVPRDPATIAPLLDPTVPTTVFAASEFLYSGSNRIQHDVAPGTIEERRAAVLRGKVQDRDGNPIPGVTVTVLNHPEFGWTGTRSDGQFDLVVNGGGILTVRYEKTGLLSVQRQIDAPWADWAWLPDVVMIGLDTRVTEIALGAGAMQAARGSTVTDTDGTREATVLFPAGTQASLVMPDGATKPLTTAHVRATEYTVGENGPKAMPGVLPTNVAYTYAVELSMDEAIAAGAKEVRFDRPVYFYVDNFLEFPVGGIVPMGWYDREKAAWIPSDNGAVVKVLSITNGLADLDTSGSGQAADAAALAALGITEAERAQLASLYTPGKSYWRVPVEHFTPWDCNWPYGPPEDAIPPPPDKPEKDDHEDPDDPTECPGCVIEAENQVLGESIPIAGTPYTLNYRSNRVPGFVAGRMVEIPVSGPSVPGSLKRIELTISVAGQVHHRTFAAASNLRTTFVWDGKDSAGRPVQGGANLSYHLRYVYRAVYYAPGEFGRAFGQVGSGAAIGQGREASEVYFTRTHTVWLGSVVPRGSIANINDVGHWSLDVHHGYRSADATLHRGDGSRHHAVRLGGGVDTVAGTGAAGYGGDGPATQAWLYNPYDITLGPDGSLYIADTGNHRIRRVGPDGIITTVVSTGGSGDGGDGGPATQARLNQPRGLALGPDGSLYIADNGNHRVRRVGPDGIITTVAGTGASGYSGDGGSATQAQLGYPTGIALGPDGSLYIADAGNNRVRRVGPDGIITTVAGTGALGHGGDGGPATQAQLGYPTGIALGPDGSLYIADRNNSRIRRVGPDGGITTVAGTGIVGYGCDGGLATQAGLNHPHGVALGPDGRLHIADTGNRRICRVEPDGGVTIVAGTGTVGYDAATWASFGYPNGIAFGPDGSLYIAETYNHRIRRVNSSEALAAVEFIVPSSDSGDYYVFNIVGRHLRTVDGISGTLLQTFVYDDLRNLVRLEDTHGNLTRIERDGTDRPVALIAPDGQRTEVTLDAHGYLASVTNPAGETYRMNYTTGGLLTSVEKPTGAQFTYQYDSHGRLLREQQPDGGGWTLGRTKTENGFESRLTSGEGRTSRFGTERLPATEVQRTTTAPDGTVASRRIKTSTYDITETSTAADGTVRTSRKVPDPRVKMDAPYVAAATTTTPSGLVQSFSATRNATLADAADPLSLTAWSERTTVNGRQSTVGYSAATRTWTRTSPAGRTSLVEINAQGRPVLSRFANLADVHYAYDARGRLSEIREGEGEAARTVSLTYDTLGNLASVTDSLGRVTSFEYDLAGRVTKQTLPDGRSVTTTYDPNGNLTSLTPPGRQAHVFAYTPVDLEEEYTPPDLAGAQTVTRYRYNRDKDLTKIERPDGKTIDLSYDSGGRLAETAIARGSHQYAYHPTTGQLSTLTAPDGGQLSYTYDGFLPLSESASGEISGTVSRSYDNNFWVTGLAVNGQAVSFAYDADGLLTQAGDLTLSRDPQNGLLTGTEIGAVATNRTYNSFGELESETATVNGEAVMTTTYTRDKLGRITSKAETIDGTTTTYGYGYDQAGRLEKVFINGVLKTTYTYDPNGNRLSKAGSNGSETGTYDSQDRLLTYAGASYEYTTNGDLKSKTESGATTHYVYDELGNLMQVRLPGDVVIDYLIDGRNRRIGKKVNGQLVQGFLYQDQLEPVAELDGDGNVVARFVYGSKGHVPDYMEKGGKTYRIISDHLGSPRLVIDTATDEVVQRMDYDEFGRVLADTHPGFQPFGFAGGICDQHVGYVRFGARDYETRTGRWIAKDPIRFKGRNTNLFSYTFADPINLIDPDGKSAAGWCTVGVVAAYYAWKYWGWSDSVEKSVDAAKDVRSDIEKREANIDALLNGEPVPYPEVNNGYERIPDLSSKLIDQGLNSPPGTSLTGSPPANVIDVGGALATDAITNSARR